MNTKKILIASLFSLLLVIMVSCKTPTKISGEYATAKFNTECLGADPNGIQTLRAWGNGINKNRAIEQAKRNAVEAVMFEGIQGTGNCNKRPLINEVNARERYENYFNAFFKEGGAYEKYIKLDEKRTSRIKSSNSEMEAWSVVVVVDRSALKERLINDNVINAN